MRKERMPHAKKEEECNQKAQAVLLTLTQPETRKAMQADEKMLDRAIKLEEQIVRDGERLLKDLRE